VSLIYLSFAWVAGILLGSKYNLPLFPIFIGLIPLPLLFLTRRYKVPIILTSLCLIAFFSGAFYYQSSLPSNESHLQFYNNNGTVEIKGLVTQDPVRGEKITQLNLSAREIRLGGEWYKISGNALLFVSRYLACNYGDMIMAVGKLETPPKLDDFDYERYLSYQEIYSTMYFPEIKVLETDQGFKLLSWIYWLRNEISQAITKVLPEPQASLVQGIVLGIRSDIPSSVKDDFNQTGTSHLLAISGLHLSIVAGILTSLGIWLFGRKGYIYVWLALGAIWLYALLTGMHLPVIRATIMASLFLITELLGRQRSAATALVFAAAIMVGISPRILWDASFQMSFTAMAGLIFIYPLIQSLCRRVIDAKLGESGAAVSIANFIADSFSISLGAIIAVWPLIAYYFGIISPVAPLANLFALPALSGVIVIGALTGVLGLILLPAAQVIAWITWLFTSYILLVVKVFSVFPVIKGDPISVKLIWIYYVVLALFVWLINNKKKILELMPKVINFFSLIPRKWIIPPLMVGAILVTVTAATMPDNKLHASFIDVGQGDAILIQRGSQQILIDGGPSSQIITLALGKVMPFWDRTIELVILTHPHADHLTGLVEVLKRYKVRQVLYPDLDYESPLFDEWLALIDKKNINYTLAQAGQQIKFSGGVILEVLNPQSPNLTGTESDIDNNGVVLHLEIGEISFLLSADIMSEAEFELMASRANLTSTVLKVAHHGSATSTGEEFLAVINPSIAVISVGEGNPFGHPSLEVMERLKVKVGQENVYRTDENGTIELVTDGERLWLRIER
jgi:competence protein ComEC